MSYKTQHLIRLWKEREHAQVTIVTVQASGSSSGLSPARDALVATRSLHPTPLQTAQSSTSSLSEQKDPGKTQALAQVEPVNVGDTTLPDTTTLEEREESESVPKEESIDEGIQEVAKEEVEAMSLSEAGSTDIEDQEEQKKVEEATSYAETESVDVGKEQNTSNSVEQSQAEAVSQAESPEIAIAVQSMTSIDEEVPEIKMETSAEEQSEFALEEESTSVHAELEGSGLLDTTEGAIETDDIENGPITFTTTRERLLSLTSLEALESDATEASDSSSEIAPQSALLEETKVEPYLPEIATCATDPSIRVAVPPNQRNTAASPKPEKRKWLERMFKSKKSKQSSQEGQVLGDEEKATKKSKPNKLVKKNRPSHQKGSAPKTPSEKKSTGASSSLFKKCRFRRPRGKGKGNETANDQEEVAPVAEAVSHEAAYVSSDCESISVLELDSNPEIIQSPTHDLEGSISESEMQDSSLDQPADGDKENIEKVDAIETPNWTIPTINIVTAADNEVAADAVTDKGEGVDGNLAPAKSVSKRLSLRRIVLINVLNRKDNDMDGEMEEELESKGFQSQIFKRFRF